MLTATAPPSFLASATRLRWPSCKNPIVGTSPSRGKVDRAARSSAIVSMRFTGLSALQLKSQHQYHCCASAPERFPCAHLRHTRGLLLSFLHRSRHSVLYGVGL